MMQLVCADQKKTKDQNLNDQGILSPAQIVAKHQKEGVGLPVSALQRVAKTSDTQKQGTQLEIDTALACGAEPSENDRHKTLKEAHCVATKFNERLELDCLIKSAGPSVRNNEKLRAYLESQPDSQGTSTTGGPVGEKVSEKMARLDKLLQKYISSHKLNLIQKLEPIDARAYARSKIFFQNRVDPRNLSTKRGED